MRFVKTYEKILKMGLSGDELLVYSWLQMYNINGCFLKQKKISELIGKSIPTVQRIISKLKDRGLITVRRGGGAKNWYYIEDLTSDAFEHITDDAFHNN